MESWVQVQIINLLFFIATLFFKSERVESAVLELRVKSNQSL